MPTESGGGRRHLSASKAIASAMVRAGYVFGTYYPGSPIVEIADELTRLAHRVPAFKFRYATNEKIAFEMSAAVALAGGRAFALMKHVGVNVALDSVMALAYTGHHGSLLLVVGDDPSCESSSSVQDSRQMARLLGVPCVEPASLYDVRAAVDCATELSAQLEAVVVLRLTTALCHGGAVVDTESDVEALESVPLRPPLGEPRFIVVPANTRVNRGIALRRLENARRFGGRPGIWHEHIIGRPEPNAPGFIVQNATYPAFERCMQRMGVAHRVWRTLLPWPLSEAAVLPFVSAHQKIVVVEALDPVLEEQIVAIVHRKRLPTEIVGSELWPRDFELDEERLLVGLRHILGVPPEPERVPLSLELWTRGPTFCAGCPHTASIHSIKWLIQQLDERPFVASDIGCYTLAAKRGIEIGDSALAMGASIGVATGMALQGLPVIALIGDSTFLHAGLPALENAVAQKVSLLVCILDNGVAAMTGGQETGPQGQSSRLYAAALGLGVASVALKNPFDIEETRAALLTAWRGVGVHVVILRSPCALTIPSQQRRPVVDEAACTGCADCVTQIHCPAISLSEAGKFQVDLGSCVGCGFCSKICPTNALTTRPYRHDS